MIRKTKQKMMRLSMFFVLFFALTLKVFFSTEADEVSTQCSLTDYANVELKLYKDNAALESNQTISLLEDGQNLIFMLSLSDFDNDALRELFRQSPDEKFDFSVETSFVGMINGNYPTEIYPTNGFDNVAMFEGKPLFRWWIDGNRIKLRFDDTWIAGLSDTTTLTEIKLGFEGKLNVGDNAQNGKLLINVANVEYFIPLKTTYGLTKTVGAPVYRVGRYEADYTITFSLSQDMDITNNPASDGYSARLTLKDTLPANSALTGTIVGGPTISGPTDGIGVSVDGNGTTEHIFSFTGPAVLKQGTYTIQYTMEISNEAVKDKLQNYEKGNTVELLENNDSLVVYGQPAPLVASAQLIWDENISTQYKLSKRIITYAPDPEVYLSGSDYYVDYCVVVYLKEAARSFKLKDMLDAYQEHSDFDVEFIGADTEPGYWDVLPQNEGMRTKRTDIPLTIVSQTSDKDREIMVSSASPSLMPAGAYFFKIPCKVTNVVAEAVRKRGTQGYKNQIELVELNDAVPIAKETAVVTRNVYKPENVIKTGAIVTDNAGVHQIYNDGSKRGKLIQWEVSFGWWIADPSQVFEDISKGGQEVLIDDQYPFVLTRTDVSPNTVLKKVTEKVNTEYLEFDKDGAGNDVFRFYLGKLSAKPNDSSGTMKLTYYTLVPEETVDFSTMTNDYSLIYPMDGTTVPAYGPITGTIKPTLGANVKMKLTKTSTFHQTLKPYDFHDMITEWKIVIDNTGNKIPINSLDHMVLTDNAWINGNKNITDKVMSVWYDMELMEGKYTPKVVLIRSDKSQVELIRGVDYELETEDASPARFYLRFHKEAIASHLGEGETYFDKIEILSYLFNTDYNNKPGAPYPHLYIKNEAKFDYEVAGQKLEPLVSSVQRNREFTTAVKDMMNKNGEKFADFVGDDGKKEMKWRIEIGAGEFNTDHDIELEIKDKLPEELRLLYDDENWRESFCIESTKKKVQIDLTDATFHWDEATNTFSLKFKKPGQGWPKEEWNIYIDYYTVFKDGFLQQKLGEVEGGTANILLEDVRNNAEIYWEGLPLETTCAQGDIQIKDIVLKKTAQWLEAVGSKVRYTIEINPHSLKQGNGDVVQLQDAMGLGKEKFIYDAASFKVTNMLTGFDMSPGDAVSDSTYVLRMADDGKSFFIDIPDETFVKLIYTVKTTAPAGTSNVTLNNSASLEGRRPEPTGITFDVKSTYQMGSFTVESGEVGIALLKVDETTMSDEVMTPLKGAKFTMTELGEDGIAKEAPTTLVSDEDGMLKVTKEIKETKIFLVEETQAPQGYKLGDNPWKCCYVMTLSGVNVDKLTQSLRTVLGCDVTVVSVGNTASEVIGNEPIVLTIRKCDPAENLIAGAEFVLKDSLGNTVLPNDSQSIPGVLQYHKLKAGTYTLQETKTPIGYRLFAESQWTFEVSTEGKVSLQPGTDYKLFSISDDEIAITITNYKIGPVNFAFGGTKKLNGRNVQNTDEFKFVLSSVSADAPMPESNVVKNNIWTGNTSEFLFGDIIFEEAGIYEYKIEEMNAAIPGIDYDDAVFIVQITVSNKGGEFLVAEITDIKKVKGGQTETVGEVVFENTYTAEGGIELQGKKSLTGKTLEADQFTFVLYEEGMSKISEVKNAANGSFVFDEIEYELTDVGMHTYTIKEQIGTLPGITYDTAVYSVNVSVTDRGDGTLNTEVLDIQKMDGGQTESVSEVVFENTYAAEGSITLHGEKSLTGKTLETNHFTFVLYDEGMNKISEVKNAANGSFVFDEIEYELTDVGMHTYTIKEETGTIPGIMYDTAVYVVKVSVTDRGDGTLDAEIADIQKKTAIQTESVSEVVFENTYVAKGSITLQGEKSLSGKTLEANQFTFVLYDEGMNKIFETKNAADGSFVFDEIEYDCSDIGIHTYTIKEQIGTLPGITYDTAIYFVNVSVTDRGDGTLDAKISGIKKEKEGVIEKVSEVEFENIYDPEGTVVLMAEKTVDRETPKADEVFEFILLNDVEVLQRVSNDGKAITFSPLRYTLSDVGKTYSYIVQEVKNESDAYEEDNRIYEVRVTIKKIDDKVVCDSEIYCDGVNVEVIAFNNSKKDVVEESPKEESPKEESPKEESSKEESSKEESPKEESSKEESPKDETPNVEALEENQATGNQGEGTSNQVESSEIVKTGDGFSVGRYVFLFVLSAIGLIWSLIKMKKTHD